jgi:hypothetical protein
VEYVLITILCSVVFYFCHAHMLIFFKKNCRMFKDELERQGMPNIERTIRQEFQTWFRNRVSVHTLRF